MTRARRRDAHRTRLVSLNPQVRWCVIHGDREARWAFATVADWTETFDSVRGALLEELDDPAATFRGFWLCDPEVPEELRKDLPYRGLSLAPEPRASEVRAEWDQLIEARRAWLEEHGYRWRSSAAGESGRPAMLRAVPAHA